LVYELGGPRVYLYRELLEDLARHLRTRTLLLPIPFRLWLTLARLAELLPSPPITRNQVELMEQDNVGSAGLPGFAELGIEPHGLRELLPTLVPSR
jgi:hypothetical protein